MAKDEGKTPAAAAQKLQEELGAGPKAPEQPAAPAATEQPKTVTVETAMLEGLLNQVKVLEERLRQMEGQQKPVEEKPVEPPRIVKPTLLDPQSKTRVDRPVPLGARRRWFRVTLPHCTTRLVAVDAFPGQELGIRDTAIGLFNASLGILGTEHQHTVSEDFGAEERLKNMKPEDAEREVVVAA